MQTSIAEKTSKNTSMAGNRITNTLIVNPVQGRSCTDVLGEIYRNANPEETGTEIKLMMKIRSGDILLELGYNTKVNSKVKGLTSAT